MKLTKPGVLAGNAITVPAGYFLAAQGIIDWQEFLAVFAGSSLVIASACVINNYLDQDIDRRMERTKSRPLTAGQVPGWLAIVFGVLLGAGGLAVLWLHTNWLVVIIGVIGFVDYVWLYGAWSKRSSWHGTLIGSISGAVPILAGYVAASGQIDLGAILVFLVLFFWQMPEFYSIAIYRRDEYAAASLPVISVVKGKKPTVTYIFVYTILFVASSLALTVFGYTSWIYFLLMGLAGSYWIYLGYQGFTSSNIDTWAKRMFRFSLLILLLFCALVSIDWLMHTS